MYNTEARSEAGLQGVQFHAQQIRILLQLFGCSWQLELDASYLLWRASGQLGIGRLSSSNRAAGGQERPAPAGIGREPTTWNPAAALGRRTGTAAAARLASSPPWTHSHSIRKPAEFPSPKKPRITMALRRALGWSEGEVMRPESKPCSRLMRQTAGIFSVGGGLAFWVLCRLHYGPRITVPRSLRWASCGAVSMSATSALLVRLFSPECEPQNIAAYDKPEVKPK